MRAKKGAPAQMTTGVASTSSTQAWIDGGSRPCSGQPGLIPPMARRKTGTVRTRPIQKRRVMSRSSVSSAGSRVVTTGSSAIPHFGHAPGAASRISGCMGQTYSRDPLSRDDAVESVISREVVRASVYFSGPAANLSRHPAPQK